MSSPSWYRLAADLVLLVHVAVVAFVVAGLALILLGGGLHWRWVRNPWFRLAHLVAIAVVATQQWLGMACPLTTAEIALRIRSGDGAYADSFVAHWLQVLLYYEAPPAAFTAVYTVFALLVVASWIAVRPAPFFARAQPGAIASPQEALRS
jgi:uncharacterized protein DUF2784